MKRDMALWAGLLAGPTVWAISFVAKVFVGGWVCVYPWKPALFAITALALLAAAGAGLLSWSLWQQLRRESASAPTGPIATAHAMALGGVVLNAGFLLVLIAQALPDMMLAGCE